MTPRANLYFSDAYRQIGNGVAVPMAEWVGRELMRYFNSGNN